MRQLIQANENVSFYAISMDSPEDSRKFLEKVGAQGQVEINFQALADPNHRTIDAYGIRDPAYNGQQFEGLPRPAIYIIDRTGQVVWAKVEEDYKKRPTNDEVRAALELLN